MNELVVISPKNFAEATDLAKALSLSALLPEALRQKPADVLLTIMTGAELGLGPTQALRAIVVIKGKATLSSDAMAALVRRRRDVCKYLRCVETTATRAVFETLRDGDPEPTKLEFTIAEAQAAGLAGGDGWRKYPKAMLRARAQAAICRLVYSDLLLGVYDPDELAPEECDVTPTPVASTSTPTAPASLDAVKAALTSKPRKREYVDVTPEPRASPPSPGADDPTRVGYGKHAAKLLAELTDVELAWYVVASQKPDAAPALAALAERYAAEERRRLPAPASVADAPFVATEFGGGQ